MKFDSKVRYRVVIPRSVEKAIASLSKKDIEHIFEKLEQLATASVSLDVKKMAGYSNIYRLRYRQYRVIYEVQEKKLIIHVLGFGHRREIYQKLKRLFGK